MQASVSDHADLLAEFEQRSPWITRFTIGGREYGGSYDAMRDPRLTRFFECFPRASSILELGSLEGGHTFGLAARQHVKRVVGIEGRPENLDKARFVQHVLGIDNVEFVLTDLETTTLASLGRFDAVFCVGVLYHLRQPWRLLREISRVSDRLFLWTHYAREDSATENVSGYRGAWYNEAGRMDPLSGLSPTSFWPTLNALRDMLRQAGFIKLQILGDDREHPNGPCVTLAASMG